VIATLLPPARPAFSINVVNIVSNADNRGWQENNCLTKPMRLHHRCATSLRPRRLLGRCKSIWSFRRGATVAAQSRTAAGCARFAPPSFDIDAGSLCPRYLTGYNNAPMARVSICARWNAPIPK
jgi:hypothetical protein